MTGKLTGLSPYEKISGRINGFDFLQHDFINFVMPIMRLLSLLIVALGYYCGTVCIAAEVLTPAEAAKLEGKDTKVTVEFIVKSCHPVLPDGEHFRLCSESSAKNGKNFVLHLTDKAVTKLRIQDLEKHFLGKRVRVTGKVKKIIFSSFPETRPGISVDDPENIELVKTTE